MNSDTQTLEGAKARRDHNERNGILWAEPPANRLKLASAVATFLDSKKRKRPATVRNYTYILNEFLTQTSATFIDQITPKIIDEYIIWLERERKAEPKTIKNKAQVIVFMLKSAGVSKPSSLVKDLVPTVEEEPAEPYTQDDLGALFQWMDKCGDQENFERYSFFLVTAAREKEVAHAQWKDIVLRGAVSHFVIQAKTYTKGDGSGCSFTPKNHERREIPLTKKLVRMLKQRQKRSKSDWIFTNENGAPEGHFLRKFKKAAFAAGLNCGKCKTLRREGRDKKVQVSKCCATYNEGCEMHYLHRLRKTRATFWHKEGVPLRTIQHWLGHKKLETTQKYLGIEDASALVDKINKAMF